MKQKRATEEASQVLGDVVMDGGGQYGAQNTLIASLGINANVGQQLFGTPKPFYDQIDSFLQRCFEEEIAFEDFIRAHMTSPPQPTGAPSSKRARIGASPPPNVEPESDWISPLKMARMGATPPPNVGPKPNWLIPTACYQPGKLLLLDIPLTYINFLG